MATNPSHHIHTVTLVIVEHLFGWVSVDTFAYCAIRDSSHPMVGDVFFGFPYTNHIKSEPLATGWGVCVSDWCANAPAIYINGKCHSHGTRGYKRVPNKSNRWLKFIIDLRLASCLTNILVMATSIGIDRVAVRVLRCETFAIIYILLVYITVHSIRLGCAVRFGRCTGVLVT